MRLGLRTILVTRTLVARPLVSKVLVVVFSVAFVGCGDFSSNYQTAPSPAPDNNDSPSADEEALAEAREMEALRSDKVQQLDRSSSIPQDFTLKTTYPPNHTTMVVIDYANKSSRKRAIDTSIAALSTELESLSSDNGDRMQRAYLEERISTQEAKGANVPEGGTIVITFYDKTEEKLKRDSFKFKLLFLTADDEMIVFDEELNVSDDPRDEDGLFFANSVTLPLTEDIFNAKVIKLGLLDKDTQAVTTLTLTYSAG